MGVDKFRPPSIHSCRVKCVQVKSKCKGNFYGWWIGGEARPQKPPPWAPCLRPWYEYRSMHDNDCVRATHRLDSELIRLHYDRSYDYPSFCDDSGQVTFHCQCTPSHPARFDLYLGRGRRVETLRNSCISSPPSSLLLEIHSAERDTVYLPQC